jgi:hypothetical protein
MPRKFQDIADDLRPDGALRDFYIHNTNHTDWNAALCRVRGGLEANCFTVDGEIRELPPSFEAIEQIRAYANPCLSIPIAGANVNCHFFCAEEIEMDFRPEDYHALDLWAALCAFFQGIVDAVGKPGIITFENAEDAVIERFEPRVN